MVLPAFTHRIDEHFDSKELNATSTFLVRFQQALVPFQSSMALAFGELLSIYCWLVAKNINSLPNSLTLQVALPSLGLHQSCFTTYLWNVRLHYLARWFLLDRWWRCFAAMFKGIGATNFFCLEQMLCKTSKEQIVCFFTNNFKCIYDRGYIIGIFLAVQPQKQ